MQHDYPPTAPCVAIYDYVCSGACAASRGTHPVPGASCSWGHWRCLQASCGQAWHVVSSCDGACAPAARGCGMTLLLAVATLRDRLVPMKSLP